MKDSSFLGLLQYTLFAQAYGCGDYGAANYNECASESTGGGTSGSSGTSSSGNKKKSSSATGGSGSGTGTAGDSQSSDASTSGDSGQTGDETQTPSGNEGTTQESTTQPTSLPATVANQVGSTPWGILLPIILGLALLFAFLIMLWKRRRRHDQTPPSNFGSGGFTPSA